MSLPAVMNRRRCTGVATVEFAICAPVLLLLLLATAEVGRLLYQYNTLTKTVRDGARYAVSKAAIGTTRLINITTDVRDATLNLVVTGTTTGAGGPLLPGLTTGDVSVTDAGNGFVSVTAVYTFAPIFASLPTFGLTEPIDLAFPLNATVIMRAL